MHALQRHGVPTSIDGNIVINTIQLYSILQLYGCHQLTSIYGNIVLHLVATATLPGVQRCFLFFEPLIISACCHTVLHFFPYATLVHVLCCHKSLHFLRHAIALAA
jgi:hypothetical protein